MLFGKNKNKNVNVPDVPTQGVGSYSEPINSQPKEVKIEKVIKLVEKDYEFALYSEFEHYIISKNQLIIDKMIIDCGYKYDTTNSAIFGMTEDISTDNDYHLGSRMFTKELTNMELFNDSIVDDILQMEKELLDSNDLNDTNFGCKLSLVSVDKDGIAQIINVGNNVMYVVSDEEYLYQNDPKSGSLSIKQYLGQANKTEINHESVTLNKDDIIILVSNDLNKVIMPHNIATYLGETNDVIELDKKFKKDISYHKKYANPLTGKSEPYNYSYMIIKVNKDFS